MTSTLHRNLIVVDGLVISRWSHEVFRAMHRGGLTAANCTCCVWEGFAETMTAVARWKRWFRERPDILTQVYSTEDIHRAKRDDKVGVILGWQNTSGFGDYLPFVQVFKELGLGIAQLTYNTANSVGSGCYESNDGGLTDFGRELVSELNRVGILIDLSHVGPKTSEDAIRVSEKPVAYSHCCPTTFKVHPRNKTDAQLKLIAEHGGFVGVTLFPPLLPRGPESTIDDYLDVLEYVINLVGEDHVGIGTDFSQGRGEKDRYYTSHDKGYSRKLVDYGPIVLPEGIRRIEDFPNLTMAMERRAWPEMRIRKVMGENWLRLLKEVWGR
jgi:membrane dipeptidase